MQKKLNYVHACSDMETRWKLKFDFKMIWVKACIVKFTSSDS